MRGDDGLTDAEREQRAQRYMLVATRPVSAWERDALLRKRDAQVTRALWPAPERVAFTPAPPSVDFAKVPHLAWYHSRVLFNPDFGPQTREVITSVMGRIFGITIGEHDDEVCPYCPIHKHAAYPKSGGPQHARRRPRRALTRRS